VINILWEWTFGWGVSTLLIHAATFQVERTKRSVFRVCQSGPVFSGEGHAGVRFGDLSLARHSNEARRDLQEHTATEM